MARQHVSRTNTSAARSAARRQGHTLSRFAVSGQGLLTATCKGCGKTLTVRARPINGQHRFFGPARMRCTFVPRTVTPAPLPVFVTNQPAPVQPIQPVLVQPAPGQPLGLRVARAFALGFAALVGSGNAVPFRSQRVAA